MTMSSSMRNVRMHCYTDATAASVPRSTLEVLVTWFCLVSFCGPTCGGKWSQQTQRSIFTQDVHKFRKGLRLSQVYRAASCGIYRGYFAASLVRFLWLSPFLSHIQVLDWEFFCILLKILKTWLFSKFILRKFWKHDFFQNSQILIFRISKKSIW